MPHAGLRKTAAPEPVHSRLSASRQSLARALAEEGPDDESGQLREIGPHRMACHEETPSSPR